MRPEIFRIPGVDLPVHGYGLMIVVGFLLGAWLGAREVRRRGLPDVVWDFGVVMLMSGLLGGRIFYYIQFYEESYAREPWYAFFFIWKGGLVFYGGAIGGAIGGLLFLVAKRAPIVDFLDAMTPYIPVAMGFGRLGCFMNGCCYGSRCSADFALAVSFPPGSGAYHEHVGDGVLLETAQASLPVYPVQLFEAGLDFALAGLLCWIVSRPHPRGGIFPLAFGLYSVSRFSLEFMRGDHDFTGLFTVSQVVALVLIPLCAILFLVSWSRGLVERGPRHGSTAG